MDLLARTVTRAGRALELKPREFRLLEYLMRHADQVVTRTMLLEAVWDYHFDPQTNVIDVHVSRLRRKGRPRFRAAAHPHRARRGLRDTRAVKRPRGFPPVAGECVDGAAVNRRGRPAVSAKPRAIPSHPGS